MSNPGLPPVVCSICTELFLFSNQHEATQLIGAAPCGHTFHLNCLNQWLSNASTCPQCRTATKKKTAIRLFFDTPAVFDGDTASQVASLTDGTITRLNARINELNSQVEAKTSALDKARSESARLAEHLTSSKELSSKARSALEEEKSKNKILRHRFDELTSKSDKVDNLMKTNETLTRKLNILDALQKVAIDECEAELEKLLQPETGRADMREVMTWLAVTSRELRAVQGRVKTLNDDMKKVRDRLAAEKVRCSSLSDELRKRSDDLTRCENELKSAEERLKKQQAELAKYRTEAKTAENSSPAVRPAPKPTQSASSACRDIFESPAVTSKVAVDTPNNNENDLKIVEIQAKKSRLAEVKAHFKEASPVTPNSVTEFRKLATKALRSATEAPMPPPLFLQEQGASSSPSSNQVQPPPIRRHYNGLGGHSMTFGFPVSNQNNKPKSFLTFPSQPATKRKL